MEGGAHLFPLPCQTWDAASGMCHASKEGEPGGLLGSSSWLPGGGQGSGAVLGGLQVSLSGGREPWLLAGEEESLVEARSGGLLPSL